MVGSNEGPYCASWSASGRENDPSCIEVVIKITTLLMFVSPIMLESRLLANESAPTVKARAYDK